MATITLKRTQPGQRAAAAPRRADPGAPVLNFVLNDNGDDTVTILGQDDRGNDVDISGLATFTAQSSDPSSVSVDPPQGATFVEHGLKVTPPGTPTIITVTAQMNSGQTFTIADSVEVQQGPPGPATHLKLVHGTPSIR